MITDDIFERYNPLDDVEFDADDGPVWNDEASYGLVPDDARRVW